MSNVKGKKFRQIEERLDGLEETIEILADRKTLRAIKKSLEEIRKGKYKDYSDVNELRAELERK